jgi:hypothetical protein
MFVKDFTSKLACSILHIRIECMMAFVRVGVLNQRNCPLNEDKRRGAISYD